MFSLPKRNLMENITLKHLKAIICKREAGFFYVEIKSRTRSNLLKLKERTLSLNIRRNFLIKQWNHLLQQSAIFFSAGIGFWKRQFFSQMGEGGSRGGLFCVVPRLCVYTDSALLTSAAWFLLGTSDVHRTEINSLVGFLNTTG